MRPRATMQTLVAFDASPVPTAITRAADGVILFANPACRELLGWQDGAFAGRTLLEMGFWTRPERRAAMASLLTRDGVVRAVEEDVRTQTGEIKTVLVSISAFELDGEPCLIGHIHDITERRSLEEQLRRSDERFRQVTETSRQGFLLSDLDPPRVVYASPAVAHIFGVDLDTVYRDPRALQDVIHPGDAADVLARRGTMTEPTDFEYRIVRPDGETRWIRTRAEPVRAQDGPQRVASVSEDVTDEHDLREALRDSEELFRLLAENSTDVIGRLSLDMRIEYVSPACRAVYGYEPEAMVGRFGWEFVHPDDLAALRDDFSVPDQPGGVVTNIYRVIRGDDGAHVWVEAKIRVRHDPVSGEPLEFHTVARDVSERVQAEADVRRAKEEAERANLAKSEFLSRMSHELRTPLHAILGFGELLEREDPRAGQRERLLQIMNAGHHLLGLINEVLDLSRIERGKLGLSLEPVCIAEVVAETLAMVEPLAAARSVTVAAETAGDAGVHVLADRQRLRQVLLNLLSNAVKYNRDGGAIRVASALAGPQRARVEVTDTGHGIAAEDLARAFDPFERLGAETGDVEGTGLGLALTRRLVEAMGGEIGAESDVGRGTTFWLELAVVDAPAAPPLPTDAARTWHARFPTRAPRTVLYVEDNPSNVRLVEAILGERPEVTLLVATHGEDGVRLAREHRPALILLDLNLPDVSGEEVLRRIRVEARCPDSAIVMLSADATPGQMARLREAGAADYLTKPFEIDRLLAVVDAHAGTGAIATRAIEATAADARAAPGSPAPQPAGPIDRSRLTKLRTISADGHALGELLGLFLREAPASLQALVTAADAGDAQAVRHAAHAWRGACSMAGLHRVATQLDAIENSARADRVPDEQALARLGAAYREAEAALLHELGTAD